MRSLRPASFLVPSAALLLALAACKGDGKSNPDVLAQDSSLTRDLQLANHDSTAQPQLKDVATTPPPAPPKTATVEPQRAAPEPTPAPRHVAVARSTPRHTPVAEQPAPAPTRAPTPAPVTTASGNTVTSSATTGRAEGKVGVVSAGTSLALLAGQRVCTNTNTVGDRITATLTEAVTASNGVVIPAGATAILEITSLKSSGSAGDKMDIGLVAKSITYAGKTYPIDGEITYAQTDQVRSATNNDAAKVGGGAVLGAILGRVMDGGNKTRGTILGGAAGAAAGAVLAHQTAKYDACIPSGGRVTVRLDTPMSVQQSAI